MRRRPADQRGDILAVRAGRTPPSGQDPVDAGALGVRGARAAVGAEDSSDRRGRQHGQKITILFGYVGHPAGPADPYRRGPPARPRVGRVGRQAAAQSGELRLLSRRCSSAGPPWRSLVALGRRRRSCCIWSLPASTSRASALPRLLWVGLGSSPESSSGSGGASSSFPIVPARRCFPSRSRSADRSSGLMRLTSRSGGPVRPAGLGRERGGQGLQRAGAAARPEGGQGRAAAAHSALPLEGDAGWCPGHRRQVRRAGVRGDAGAARPPGDPGAAPARRGGGGVRAGHGERTARRRGQDPGARAHDDAAVGTLQGCAARPRASWRTG